MSLGEGVRSRILKVEGKTLSVFRKFMIWVMPCLERASSPFMVLYEQNSLCVDSMMELNNFNWECLLDFPF